MRCSAAWRRRCPAVQAESAGSIWISPWSSAHGAGPAGGDRRRRVFQVTNIGLGGIGGRPGKDGLATTAFPQARTTWSR